MGQLPIWFRCGPDQVFTLAQFQQVYVFWADIGLSAVSRANSRADPLRRQESGPDSTVTDSDEDVCAWESDLVITSADTVLTCVVVLTAAALIRESIARVSGASGHAAWQFPALEGPIFLAEYLGLTKALLGIVRLDCPTLQSVGITFLLAPVLLLPIAFLRILAHIRRADVRFLHLQSPSSEMFRQRGEMFPSRFGKLFSILPFLARINERGVWQHESSGSQRWNFMIHYYWGRYWTYTLW